MVMQQHMWGTGYVKEWVKAWHFLAAIQTPPQWSPYTSMDPLRLLLKSHPYLRLLQPCPYLIPLRQGRWVS
jgi:hypothetical protein